MNGLQKFKILACLLTKNQEAVDSKNIEKKNRFKVASCILLPSDQELQLGMSSIYDHHLGLKMGYFLV